MTESVSRYSPYELAVRTRELRAGAHRRFLKLKKKWQRAKEHGKPGLGEVTGAFTLALGGAGALLAAFAYDVDMVAISGGLVVEGGLIGNALGAVAGAVGGHELEMRSFVATARRIRRNSNRSIRNLAARFESKRRKEREKVSVKEV